MKKIVFLIGILVAFSIISCQRSAESKLIGTWKAIDVETNFDETRISAVSINQLVEMQKQTYFRFMNDTVMVIISAGNTYEAKWQLHDDSQKITYTFDNDDEFSPTNDLGVFVDDQIVATSKLSMGDMIVYFEKE